MLWRNITINPWVLLCCSQQQRPLSEQLFPFSGFAARFNSAVSNLALQYSADSNFSCFVFFCRQGIIFLSWPFARCSTRSWVFDPSHGLERVYVCACASMSACRILLLDSISPYYNLLVEYLLSIYEYLFPHILWGRKDFTHLLKWRCEFPAWIKYEITSTEIVGSNSTSGMDVCLLSFKFDIRDKTDSLRRHVVKLLFINTILYVEHLLTFLYFMTYGMYNVSRHVCM